MMDIADPNERSSTLWNIAYAVTIIVVLGLIGFFIFNVYYLAAEGKTFWDSQGYSRPKDEITDWGVFVIGAVFTAGACYRGVDYLYELKTGKRLFQSKPAATTPSTTP